MPALEPELGGTAGEQRTTTEDLSRLALTRGTRLSRLKSGSFFAADAGKRSTSVIRGRLEPFAHGPVDHGEGAGGMPRLADLPVGD